MKHTDYLSRRRFAKKTGAFLILGALAPWGTWADEIQVRRPNLLLIVADDLGFSDLGCYGGEIQTPNLDRLASNGLRFTQFYNAARCIPTRASILTGLYPHQCGLGAMWEDHKLPGYRGDIQKNCVTMGEVLRESGYATYLTGKWGVTNQVGWWYGEKEFSKKDSWPLQRGFDRFYGTPLGVSNHYNTRNLVLDNEIVAPWTPGDADTYHFTEATTHYSLRFLNEHLKSKPDQPFLLYIGYGAPHWAMHAPDKYVDKYKGHYAKGWDAVRTERLRRMVSMGIANPAWKLSARDREVPSWEKESNKQWQQRLMEVYAGMVDQMDEGIGRIIATLEKADQLDNTLILFISDNGGCGEDINKLFSPDSEEFPHTTLDGRPMKIGNNPLVMPGPADTFQSYSAHWANVSNTPFRLYKRYVHEGGIATPLIAHWPARIKKGGALRHQIGHVIDLMATCIDAAGAEYPSHYKGQKITPLEGLSLVPAFDNKPIQREAIYGEHMGNRFIRAGKWKLVSEYDKPWELFDLETDRTETDNLASKRPEKVRELTAKYEDWARRCNVEPWSIIKEKIHWK